MPRRRYVRHSFERSDSRVALFWLRLHHFQATAAAGAGGGGRGHVIAPSRRCRTRTPDKTRREFHYFDIHTSNNAVYHVKRPLLSPLSPWTTLYLSDKLTTRCDDRRAVHDEIFHAQSLRGKCHILQIPESLYTQCLIGNLFFKKIFFG